MMMSASSGYLTDSLEIDNADDVVQCMRRWRDEGDKMQLYNAGKYGSAMLAVVMKLSYATNQSTVRLVLFILASCFATSYQLYWDLVVDWGLLQRNSKNRWLRDSLVLKRKYLYFISMVRQLLTMEIDRPAINHLILVTDSSYCKLKDFLVNIS